MEAAVRGIGRGWVRLDGWWGRRRATGVRVTNNVFCPQVFADVGCYGSVAHRNTGGTGNACTGNRTVDGWPVTP